MAEFSKLVITGKGQELIAKVIAGEGNIEFTKVSTSDSIYSVEQLEMLEQLENVKQTSLISRIVRTNNVAVKIDVAFNNMELAIGYYIRSLGLYAVDPDVGEILYAVTTEITGNCYMPPNNGATSSGLYIQLVTAVGNAENVFLEVDQTAVATIGNIKDLQSQIDAVEYPNFEDWSEGTEIPDARSAIAGIKSNTSLKGILKNVKAALMGLVTMGEMRKLLVNNGLCTENGKYFLDAVQANPDIEGTLANQVSKINSKLKKIYSITEGTFTVDVKAITDDYANLTDENFILVNSYIKHNVVHGGNADGSLIMPSFSMSYNSTDGILTIHNVRGWYHKYKVVEETALVIVGDIYIV